MNRRALAMALLAMSAGCPRPGGQVVAWKDFWRLREVRSRLTLVEDPGARAGAPRYLSIAGNAYFVGLPGIPPGSQAVVRVRVAGVFPGPARLVTIAGPVTVGPDGSFRLDDFPSLGTFPLRGQPLALELTVRTVSGNRALNFSGRMAGVGSFLRRFDPRQRFHVDTMRSLATSMFAFVRAPVWKLHATLPADLRAGTHVLIARPPPGSPSALRERVNLRFLTTTLRVRNRLILWRDGDRELVEAPYIVLRVTPHRRHPMGRHPEIVSGLRRVDRLLAQGKHAKALEATDGLERTIDRARAILERERSLEVRRLDLLRARIRADQAFQRRNLPARDRFRRRELAVLRQILRGFRGFLTPRERAVFQARLTLLGDDLKAR